METKFPLNDFTEILTPRLRIREVRNTDVSDFFRIRSNPENMRYIPRPVAQSEQDILDFFALCNETYQKGDGLNLGIALKDSDVLIGSIGFYRTKWYADRSEIGYILSEDHRGKGYMHEAISAIIQFGFEKIGFHSLEAIIDPRNSASINVVEKVGFVKEGHLKECDYWNGEYLDSLIYSLINPKHN